MCYIKKHKIEYWIGEEKGKKYKIHGIIRKKI
jgi:hypothetical protein